MIVTINGKYFTTQHQLTGLCNGECEYLLFSGILFAHIVDRSNMADRVAQDSNYPVEPNATNI